MSTLHIPVILGTARKDRESEKAARFMLREAEKFGFSTELLDVGDHMPSHTTPSWEGSEVTKPWQALMEKADGLIIVSPEYNHGYPGELKMVLDMAYQEYQRKPVMLCGVSVGPWGGARMVDHIKQVFIELQMVPTRNAVYFPNTKEVFDENGEPKNPIVKESVKTALNELAWYAEALYVARSKK